MAKITNRKALSGNNVSHANNRTKRKQNLNMQTRTIDGITVRIPNREWKTLKKAA